jgi:excalibur calcium-binding domain-containing protein
MLSTTPIRIAVVAMLAMFAVAAFVPNASAIDRDCSDFNSWRAAQKFYKKHNPRQDPHGLDADHDGIACEDLR